MTSRERPLSCARDMVAAIAADRKTQTRRVMVPQPVEDPRGYLVWADRRGLLAGASLADAGWWLTCPYGHIRDRLWVREALVRSPTGTVQYAFDGAPVLVAGAPARWGWQRAGLPARYMPKYAARFWLEITDVRVERIQGITDADAQAEGVQVPERTVTHYAGIYRSALRRLWDRLNVKPGHDWNANPWVWVLVFTRSAPATELHTPT